MADRAGTDVTAALERARARLAAGDLTAARRECDVVIASGDATASAAAHLVLSGCAKRAGDPAAQQRHVERALTLDPGSALVQYAMAELHEKDGATEAAIGCLERAVALKPDFVAAYHQLGILRGEAGDTFAAAAAFGRVVSLDPGNARGYNNLGNALRTLGRFDEAAWAFERAVTLKPDYALAIANLVVHARDMGDSARAEKLARDGLARAGSKPPRALVVLLAGMLRERGALDEAEPLYEEAIALAADASAGEWFNLGRVYAERDETERARTAYRHAHAADRGDLRGAIGSRLALPMIYADAAELEAARGAYTQGLEALHADVERLVAGLTSAQVLDGLRWTNFFLAYQGRDDRGLQAKYAAFLQRALAIAAPQWQTLDAAAMPRTRAADATRTDSSQRPISASSKSARLKVGFASAFFHTGTAGRYFRSWVTDLPREGFEIHVYHLYPGLDEIATEVKARADHFTQFGGGRVRPSIVAPVIRDDALDVLIYPELGMDFTSFALAALRLAPCQLAGWGHPVTSGHPTIDGFVTCADMEPADADSHYTEPLISLPGIGTCYRSLALPDPGARAKFGLPDGVPLFLCPQSLFKVHPDNDELFAEVLAANPDALLVMFDGRHPRVSGIFVRRMTRALDARGVAAERLRILAPVPHDDYLRVNLLCDAMLDTLHWSGGNTSLDALACGLPVVTLPGAFMRGRQSHAMLRIVGVPELVASDRAGYVTIASRLARDPAWRSALAARIRDSRHLLFDTKAPIEAFARMLTESRDAPRKTVTHHVFGG